MGKRGDMEIERRGSGKPVLFVHGLGGTRRSWDTILEPVAAQREAVLVDLPGFGATPPLEEVTMASLTDAVEATIREEGLEEATVVGSSMGARMALELARRGHHGAVLALDPGGFWTDREQAVFGASVGASIALVRAIAPTLPVLTGNPVTRTALLGQFSAKPWALDGGVVLQELRSFVDSASFDEALDALRHGPKQAGAATTPGRVVVGWGKQDLVTLPRQAKRVQRAFPQAELRWFDRCGHFPHWDQPRETVELILEVSA